MAEEIPAGRDGQRDSAAGQPAARHQVSFGPVAQSGSGTVNQVGVDESTVLVVGDGEDRFSAIAVEPPAGRLPKRVRGRDRLLETLRAAVDVPDGLIHVLLDNGVHDSTGGQATVSPVVDFAGVALACGYRNAFVCDTAAGFAEAFAKALTVPGPVLVHARIKPGSLEKLGRPTIAPHEVAQRFRNFLARAGA